MPTSLISRPWFYSLSLLLSIFLLLVVQYRIWFDDTGVIASAELQQKIVQLQQDNDVQKDHNDALIAEVKDLKQGTALLEEKAREDLGLVREGETFILFVDPQVKRK